MSSIPRFRRQCGITHLQRELEEVERNSVFVDVCGLSKAHFEEIMDEEYEESLFMALPDGSRFTEVIKDASLTSIATQLKQLEEKVCNQKDANVVRKSSGGVESGDKSCWKEN